MRIDMIVWRRAKYGLLIVIRDNNYLKRINAYSVKLVQTFLGGRALLVQPFFSGISPVIYNNWALSNFYPYSMKGFLLIESLCSIPPSLKCAHSCILSQIQNFWWMNAKYQNTSNRSTSNMWWGKLTWGLSKRHVFSSAF